MSRPRLGVGVVGAGRVGAALAHLLAAAGHAVVGVSGSSAPTLERIGRLLPQVPVLAVQDVVERSELLLLTVPDDDLAPLVRGLAELGAFHEGQLVVHTAGRYGLDVLDPARAAGVIPLAIHPAMTFTDTDADLSRLQGAPFAVTADRDAWPIAAALVVEMGGEPVALPERARGLYHAALAHGANHLVTVVAQARSVLEAAGIADAGPLVGPLVEAAAHNAVRRGDAALTGPIARGDAGTVAEHVRALRAHADRIPDVVPTYEALARATVARAVRARRLRPGPAQALLDALEPAPSHRSRMRVVYTVSELRAQPARGRRAVVMTMGALHEGHLELVRQAARHAEEVVVTIFVNPLQFGASEDLDTYPRTLDSDLEALRATGCVDLVFAPGADQMYPQGPPEVSVSAGALGEVLEGAVRPGHFDGMLTVVTKLLHLTEPDVALFGQKDAQQLAVIRRMVADLDLGIEIVAVPTVRDPDGLALSSRNVALSQAERSAALVLSRAVRAGAAAAADGPDAVLAAATSVLDRRDPRVHLDYLALVNSRTLRPHEAGPATGEGAQEPPDLLLVAAKVGSTRLIDNAVIET